MATEFKELSVEEFRKLSKEDKKKYFKDNYGFELEEDITKLNSLLQDAVDNVKKAFEDLK